MPKKIRTYRALQEERQKTEALLEAQKDLVLFELEELKSDLSPVTNTIDFLKKISRRNRENPLIQSGVNLLIDLLAKKLTGKDAGIIKKKIIPYIIKNYASHLVAGKTGHFINDLVSYFQANGHSTHEEETNPGDPEEAG